MDSVSTEGYQSIKAGKSMTKNAIIECQEVSRQYQMGEVTVDALQGIDLELERGEIVVLLGPSGSGKTTTLNVIGGLDKVTGGKVLFEGTDITNFDDRRLTEYRRNSVGFVFQFFNLIPSLTAVENVEFALAIGDKKGDDHERALELLSLVDLDNRVDHFPSQLSGGEQQRVAVARALANHPPLLLCDEPTGNLDVEMGRQVLGVIEDFNLKNDTTVLLITHNTAIAPIGNRIVRLRDGRIDQIEINSERQAAKSLEW
jgi:putative ABC transport system ATP-binding protein